MPLITVKPKFQVTIPAKLRDRIALREGDLLEATLVAGGILLRPKAVVDRAAVADRIEAIFREARPSAKDATRAEGEIMKDVVAEVAKAGTEKRNRRA